MTLTISLSPEEEARLREKAARWGQDEAAYAAGVLRNDLHTLPTDEEPAEEQSLSDFLEGYIGTVDSSVANGGRLSHYAGNSEEEFGKIMDEKLGRAGGITFQRELWRWRLEGRLRILELMAEQADQMQ